MTVRMFKLLAIAVIVVSACFVDFFIKKIEKQILQVEILFKLLYYFKDF